MVFCSRSLLLHQTITLLFSVACPTGCETPGAYYEASLFQYGHLGALAKSHLTPSVAVSSERRPTPAIVATARRRTARGPKALPTAPIL